MSGKYFNFIQFLNRLLICFILFKYHLPISGTKDKDEHPLNRHSKISNFSTFHFEMSGNCVRDAQLKNKLPILQMFDVFHFERSGKIDNFVQL